MLRLLHAIKPFLENMIDEDVQTFQPTSDKRIDIHRLLKTLENMNSITKILQSESITLYNARIMFNAHIEQDLIAMTRLDVDAPTVENSTSEKAFVRLQSKVEDLLTFEKYTSLLSWKSMQ